MEGPRRKRRFCIVATRLWLQFSVLFFGNPKTPIKLFIGQMGKRGRKHGSVLPMHVRWSMHCWHCPIQSSSTTAGCTNDDQICWFERNTKMYGRTWFEGQPGISGSVARICKLTQRCFQSVFNMKWLCDMFSNHPMLVTPFLAKHSLYIMYWFWYICKDRVVFVFI